MSTDNPGFGSPQFEESEKEEHKQELRRLLACYQLASRDDKNVVWAALNKYMPYVKI